MGKTTPCHKCDMRAVGCHSICEDYLDWQAQHLEEKKKVQKQKDDKWALTDFRRDRIESTIRRHGGHKR